MKVLVRFFALFVLSLILSCNNSAEPESVVFKVEYLIDGGTHVQVWFTNEAKELESVEVQQDNIQYSKIQYISFPVREEPKIVTLRVKSLSEPPSFFSLQIQVNGQSAASSSVVDTGEFDITITADIW